MGMVSDRALEMMMQVAVPQSLDSLSRAEMIMRRFQAAISVGVLNVGDRLPPESTLSEHLGVSPLTLRHGLHMLRDKGLVDTRRGRGGGSIISGQVEILDEDIDERLGCISTDDLKDLFDVAATIARGAARLGAMRADEQDVSWMRSRNAQFLSEVDSPGLRRADGRFHISLGVAAQSRQITSLLVRIQTDVAPISWHSEEISSRKLEAYEEHEAIIAAIAAGDVELADSLGAVHFESEQILAVERHLKLVTNETRTP